MSKYFTNPEIQTVYLNIIHFSKSFNNQIVVFTNKTFFILLVKFPLLVCASIAISTEQLLEWHSTHYLLLFVNFPAALQCYIVQCKDCKNAIEQVVKSL